MKRSYLIDRPSSSSPDHHRSWANRNFVDSYNRTCHTLCIISICNFYWYVRVYDREFAQLGRSIWWMRSMNFRLVFRTRTPCMVVAKAEGCRIWTEILAPIHKCQWLWVQRECGIARTRWVESLDPEPTWSPAERLVVARKVRNTVLILVSHAYVELQPKMLNLSIEWCACTLLNWISNHPFVL